MEIPVLGQFVCYLIKKVFEAFDGYPWERDLPPPVLEAEVRPQVEQGPDGSFRPGADRVMEGRAAAIVPLVNDVADLPEKETRNWELLSQFMDYFRM